MAYPLVQPGALHQFLMSPDCRRRSDGCVSCQIALLTTSFRFWHSDVVRLSMTATQTQWVDHVAEVQL
jgi:hypothetical protein